MKSDAPEIFVDEPDGRTPGFEFFVEVWKRRKWVAILVFVAGLTGVAGVTYWLPNLYRATATVLVEMPQVSEEFVRSSVTAQLETRIQSIQQELSSRARLEDLIARLNLYPNLKRKGVALGALVERLRRDIKLETTSEPTAYGRGRTTGLAISYSGRDPDTVAHVANVLASFYVIENTRIREGQAVKTAEFLKQQVAGIKQELDAQERQVTGFNLTYLGELPQQVAANLASLERLNTQLRLNGDNQIRAIDRRERLERQLVDVDAAAIAPPAALPGPTSAAQQAAALRRQLDELKRKFTDQYPEVIRVRAELDALERQLSERGAATATPSPTAGAPDNPRRRLLQAIQDTDTELRVLKDEEQALRKAIISYEQRVENVPKREEELQALTRDHEATKERYDTMLKRYEEAQLAARLEQGEPVEQFRILDAAMPPSEPAAPNRGRLFILGVMLSIALAVGVVLLVEKVDTSFHSVDELRAFVPIRTVFTIPRISTSADTLRQWRRLAVTAVSVVLGLALIVGGSWYVASDNERIARVITRERL